MRHILPLTLVLLLVVSGVGMAATITWSGQFNGSAEYESGYETPEDAAFFGAYSTKASVGLSVGISKDQGIWDASFAVSGLLGNAPSLGKYTVNINEDAFRITAWGNYNWAQDRESIGNRGDALGLLTMSGRNEDKDPKFRVTTEPGGVRLAAQLEKPKIMFNAANDFDGVTLGTTSEHTFAAGGNDPYHRFAVYGGTEFGAVSLDAAFATTTEFDDERTAFGLSLGADLTDAMSVGGYYMADGGKYGTGNSTGVEASFEQGLFQAGAEYDVDFDDESSELNLGAIYRGSEDNVAFNALFAPAHYFKNVALAVGAKYTGSDAVGAAASVFAFDAATPVMPGKFWVKGNLTLSSNRDGFNAGVYGDGASTATAKQSFALDGYAKVGEKMTLTPHLSVNQWTDAVSGARSGNAGNFKAEVGASYAVAADATLSAKFGQDSRTGTDGFSDPTVNRYHNFGVTVKF